MPPLLKVENLSVEFMTDKGPVQAVDNVSFEVGTGEPVGIVGESGSGKSVTALTILQLVPNPPGRITSGRIELDGVDILSKTQAGMRKIRGDLASMIFQEPMTALNPVFTIGNQMTEVIRVHRKVSQKEALEIAVRMLDTVNIPNPAKCVKQHPHELSGGMRQRVMIAMALSCDPKLLIADEPTTALDVTVQAQVLDEIHRQQEERNMGMILITHDLGVVAETCKRVIVMYKGKIVEIAETKELFRNPQHPYTRKLLNSVLTLRD
ncbi:peptide ABC transporter ATP-binding protein [Coraliomargarita sinensis]|uniref:Peptide ABC transporter ATP-binding protein n=1 Tax=Coraliomargarita sinensis TaxID=2174842 RepID=A0A317ZJZ7_9BACT|nr:ABC transporter ATP-binding protein [Coraliomargarita sinensis]PXA05332.1 peptide ABC transporter ATP-binding protein [Coraliomargarita sinensis]